jgi:hypothetical protein
MLTIEQKVCNSETWVHINKVQYYLNLFIKELIDRGNIHDKSKLESPEVEVFTEFTDRLAGSTFGSKEYNEFKEQMKLALEHHYANNRHHPEHFKSGIEDMNLIDLIEMFCDWKASSLRHNNGNLLKSIEINSKRFNMNDQLTKIFENTADFIEQ